jgi:hypothetical protein
VQSSRGRASLSPPHSPILRHIHWVVWPAPGRKQAEHNKGLTLVRFIPSSSSQLHASRGCARRPPAPGGRPQDSGLRRERWSHGAMEHRARRRPHDIAPSTVCTFAPFWQQVYVCFPSPSTAIWIRFLISALAGDWPVAAPRSACGAVRRT